MEQYSQGHLNMMQRIKVTIFQYLSLKINEYNFQELQRQLDCTVGKPGSFHKKGQTRPMTVGARLCRMENMVKFV